MTHKKFDKESQDARRHDEQHVTHPREPQSEKLDPKRGKKTHKK